MKRLLTTTRALLISLLALAYNKAYAFVGGASGGGGGGGSYHSSYTNHHDGHSDPVTSILFCFIILICIFGIYWLYGLYENTELGKLNKKKKQEAYIKKCKFTIAAPKRASSPIDIDHATKSLQTNAQNTLSNISCLADYDYERIVKQTKNLFLKLEKAWSKGNFFDLLLVCVNGPYTQKLKNQMDEMAKMGVYNYIDKTDIQVCSLVKCYQPILSGSWVLRFVVKGEHIDEYLTEKYPSDTSKFKTRAFNCLVDITLSDSQLKIYNIIISMHADDYVMKEARKLPSLPRSALTRN